jgi:hypothetical protein
MTLTVVYCLLLKVTERHMKPCSQSVTKVSLSSPIISCTVSLNDTYAYQHCCYVVPLFVTIIKTARMMQVHQGAVGLCWKIMIPEWNNWASFHVVVTLIEIKCVIGNLTSWTFFIIFILVYTLFYIHVLLEFVFCIAVGDVLCVGWFITQSMLQVHCVAVKKISPSETKFSFVI